MSQSILQKKFFAFLQIQKGFNLLSEEQQSDLLKKFSNASDDQLLRAIGTLKLLESEVEELEQSPDVQKYYAESAVKIQQEMKKVDREELKIAEEDDKKNIESEAEKLLDALDKIDVS